MASCPQWEINLDLIINQGEEIKWFFVHFSAVYNYFKNTCWCHFVIWKLQIFTFFTFSGQIQLEGLAFIVGNTADIWRIKLMKCILFFILNLIKLVCPLNNYVEIIMMWSLNLNHQIKFSLITLSWLINSSNCLFWSSASPEPSNFRHDYLKFKVTVSESFREFLEEGELLC